MTATGMTSVIAAVLASHACEVVYYIGGAGHVSCHGCDGNWASFSGFHEHQARAVLAAISEAGNVQFGVKGEGRVKEYGRDRRRATARSKGARCHVRLPHHLPVGACRMRRRWTVEFLPSHGWATTRKFWTWRGAERWAARMSEGYNNYSINFTETGRKP